MRSCLHTGRGDLMQYDTSQFQSDINIDLYTHQTALTASQLSSQFSAVSIKSFSDSELGSQAQLLRSKRLNENIRQHT